MSDELNLEVGPEETSEVKSETQPLAAEPELAPSDEPVKEESSEEIPSAASEPIVPDVDPANDPIISDVYVSFDDEQLGRILAAKLGPAQVRNEMGLALVHGEKAMSLGEAIVRAKAKYQV